MEWALIIMAAMTSEPSITVATYKTEALCKAAQQYFLEATSDALEHAIEKPDKNGFTWGPGMKCSKVGGR